MAILDKLLSTASDRQVDAVLLEPGKPPQMLRTGVAHEITRVPLDSGTIARLVAEIAPGPRDSVPVPVPECFEYHVGDRTFQFAVRGGGWIAELKNGSGKDGRAGGTNGTPPAPPPAAPPVAWSPGAPVVTAPLPLPSIEVLLRLLVDRGGSDLHLSSGQVPRMRLNGDLVPLSQYAPPSASELKKLLFAVAPPRNREEFEAASDTDFAVELPGKGRFRANLFGEREGIGAVFRQIPFRIPTAEDLGLPPAVRKLAELSRGLVLVTGPTGSGKSTTLAALIDLINQTRSDHIITIEDPVEFVHSSKGCLVHHREVGVHTASFKRALRAALREDPDVVLVGEMRDLETTSIAIETAETGHLVFGTLHTTTAASTVDRLIDQYPGEQQGQIRLMLAESLRAVIAQTLVKRTIGGRVAAYEIMICTPAVANLIREGKTFQIPSAMQTGRKMGMMLLNDSLAKLVENRIVDPREAYLKAIDKDDLLNRLRALGIDAQAVAPTMPTAS
jgi:twitching motility protein PilT